MASPEVREGRQAAYCPPGVAARWRRAARIQNWLPFLAVGLLLVGFLMMPLVRIMIGSVNGPALDLAAYFRILHEPLYARVLLRTLKISFWVTFLCILLGYPVAYLLANARRRAAAIMTVLLLVPLFTAFLIRTYAWMLLLGRKGHHQ
jgi:putative spermidine/putrescine transport system permease protein